MLCNLRLYAWTNMLPLWISIKQSTTESCLPKKLYWKYIATYNSCCTVRHWCSTSISHLTLFNIIFTSYPRMSIIIEWKIYSSKNIYCNFKCCIIGGHEVVHPLHIGNWYCRMYLFCNNIPFENSTNYRSSQDIHLIRNWSVSNGRWDIFMQTLFKILIEMYIVYKKGEGLSKNEQHTFQL